MTGLSVLNGYFVNYEVTKLHINNPVLLNSLIYLTLFIAILATLRKSPSTLLDFSQTEQLKGLAMIFVVVGHFWYHVCNENDSFLVFGDNAVTLFLLLSGYGLMSSNMARKVHAREFFTKRLRKILVPYWLVTLGIIIADYVLLQKSYHLHELILTFAGINVSKATQYLDHTRWFITLLLINYLAFFVCARLWKPHYATLILIFFSISLILLRRYELFPLGGRDQLLAFPLGCLLAVVGPVTWWNAAGMRHQLAIVMLVALTMLSIYLISIIGWPSASFFFEKGLIFLQSYVLPYLFCLLCIVSISLLASLGYISRFLSLCGSLSYELYLVHGPLLIKYNPILGNFENGFTLIGLLLWFGVAMGLAYVLKASTSKLLNATIFTNRLR